MTVTGLPASHMYTAKHAPGRAALPRPARRALPISAAASNGNGNGRPKPSERLPTRLFLNLL